MSDEGQCRGFLPGANPSRCVWCGVKVESHSPQRKESEDAMSATYVEEKRCCVVCDHKKVCHVCGEHTLFACSDCQINFKATVYVCTKQKCRDTHERKCCGAAP